LHRHSSESWNLFAFHNGLKRKWDSSFRRNDGWFDPKETNAGAAGHSQSLGPRIPIRRKGAAHRAGKISAPPFLLRASA
jgi:hypothetical protein